MTCKHVFALAAATAVCLANSSPGVTATRGGDATSFIPVSIAQSVTDTLTLAACREAAEANHPLQANRTIHDRIAELRLRNLGTASLPALRLAGQATYLSDVPTSPFGSADGPTVSNDQYRVGVTAEQIIYAGGLTSASRELERVIHDLEQQSISVEVYQVRQRVEDAYFGALLHQSAEATLSAALSSLEARRDQMGAQIREGVLPAGAADVLEVEIIRVRQQISDAEAARETALATLSVLTGLAIPSGTVLQTSGGSSPDTVPLQGVDIPELASGRPEFEALSLKRASFVARSAAIRAQRRPQFGAVGEAAYGRPPGQDFFRDSFEPFYSVGLILRWAPWDWGRSTRELSELRRRADLVEGEEAELVRQIRIAADAQTRDVERLSNLLTTDDQIVELRAQITSRAAGRLEQGTITATEYLLEEIEERRARLAREVHRVQLQQARARLATVLGL